MPIDPAVIDAALIAYVATVALIDWRTHRIPNRLSAAAAAIGVISQVSTHGAPGLLVALGGAAVGLGMLLPFYLVRVFGAGDVKAMATVGIFLGLKITVIAVAMTLMAGAVLGGLVLWLNPAYASAAFHRFIGLIVAPVAMTRARPDASPQPSLRFPYGTAIAAGTVAAMFFTGRTQLGM